jgi:2-polyprenyl-3-methyl-5-hydroxy-6-metoxy-1,4-benzoquinol methylase
MASGREEMFHTGLARAVTEERRRRAVLSLDKAGRAHWDATWNQSSLPPRMDPRAPGIANRVIRKYHARFEALLDGTETEGKRLLEIGCARSVWLPYFAREFGFSVEGLDYSELGCRCAEEVLRRENVTGTVTRGDMFAAPSNLVDQFDMVTSFGVAEHFEDTAACIAAMARFLKPGGLIFTSVPNMAGILGLTQKYVHRPVYDIHVPLDREALQRAHLDAGLLNVTSDYFLSANFGMCNLSGAEPSPLRFAKKALLAALSRASNAMWKVEDLAGDLALNRLTSAYVVCTARKSG